MSVVILFSFCSLSRLNPPEVIPFQFHSKSSPVILLSLCQAAGPLVLGRTSISLLPQVTCRMKSRPNWKLSLSVMPSMLGDIDTSTLRPSVSFNWRVELQMCRSSPPRIHDFVPIKSPQCFRRASLFPSPLPAACISIVTDTGVLIPPNICFEVLCAPLRARVINPLCCWFGLIRSRFEG